MVVHKMLVDMVWDWALVKSIASADKIAMMLLPGESKVRKGCVVLLHINNVCP
ncbi:MAG: hypothetical protein MIO93_12195 [ANME-2 cluster archaeon]|nr:hypothetical protein [ANME-2 cluster archaeon]